MLQPLEQWIFEVPPLWTTNLIFACFHSAVYDKVQRFHSLSLCPNVFFVFPPSICLRVSLSSSHFALLPWLSLEAFFLDQNNIVQY